MLFTHSGEVDAPFSAHDTTHDITCRRRDTEQTRTGHRYAWVKLLLAHRAADPFAGHGQLDADAPPETAH
jgi:hypothetical protein